MSNPKQWQLSGTDGRIQYTVHGEATPGEAGVSMDEVKAATQLFSAAPKMLSALQAIIKATSDDIYHGDDILQMLDYAEAMEMVNAAVAEATLVPE